MLNDRETKTLIDFVLANQLFIIPQLSLVTPQGERQPQHAKNLQDKLN